MVINFFSLEKSEFELKQNFLEFLDMCYRNYAKVFGILKEDKINDEIISEFLNKKMTVRDKKRDIRDDCIWIISKDQPRANHLRFIIAVLYASWDLQRIGEQTYNILVHAKNIWNATPPFPKKLRSAIANNIESSFGLFQSISDVLKSENDYSKYYDELHAIVSNFREEYQELLTNTFKELTATQIKKAADLYSFWMIIKYVDRIIDHLWSIYDHFLNIRNKD
ncbi:MAG: hypothetical protein HUJ42_03675 [Malacoplasma sp.]|nr:hypothetical protein [Malacoplasma sp.]